MAFDLSRFASGAGVPTLNRNHVHDENVWITPDIKDQRRIVAVLDRAFAALDRARANVEANLADALELFERQFAAAFENVPNDWRKNRLGQIATKVGSGATPRGGAAAYKSFGISLIRSLNVYDRRFKEEKLAFIDEDQAEKLKNVVVEHRDVLLNITGASIARCCIAPHKYLPARVNQHVSIIRTDSSILLPEFLVMALTSQPYKDRLLRKGESNGATRQALTKALIQDFEVRFPESIIEQRALVEALERAEARSRALVSGYESKIQDLNNLRKSILQKAFAGKLT